MTASSIFVYSMVTKVWRKKMLLVKDVANLETDVPVSYTHLRAHET